MVAITVILAAVIGTFVLGLGDSLGDSQPTAQLNVGLDYDNDNVTIEHNGGDSIESDELSVIVEVDGTSYESNGTYSERLGVGDTFVGEGSGGGGEISDGSEVRIRVIHESSESVLLDQSFEATGTLNIEDDFTLSEA
jgi:FlaG/FlaF family flagellin (archaellin)